MPDNDDRRNDREYEDRIKAILDEASSEIGVRVEHDDHQEDEGEVGEKSIAPERGRPIWVPYVPGDEVTVGKGAHADPPSVLLYDKRRLTVRNDVQSEFADLPGVDVETREPYPGLAELGIFDVSASGDAYDVMTRFYERYPLLEPSPPPIGQYDPFAEPREVDAVSLSRYYLSASHVFFWPENRKSKSNAVLQPAPNGDDRVVVVIDTGINPAHHFLAAEPGGADYLRGQADDAEWPGAGLAVGHGTGVAAVVRQHNGRATIRGARVQLGPNQVNALEETQIVAAIDRVIKKFPNERQLVVLNLSFGGPALGTPALYAKIQEFIGRPNRRVVAAAGNVTTPNDRRPMQPAAWPIVYAVASHDKYGQIDSWSNYDTPGYVWVDTARNGDVDTADGSTQADVVSWRGTSFAAPQVAATI